ncbi:AAA-like domain-containing protein [Funiculus sociatus GB2-A5]|uniref:AAA-like domain-containing protein n=1 Tax=Funiculus sociatus GB2-A5 TaxID=2933946 RepID=A0ABV0JKY7_9CYAN|nr:MULTISPECIES: hypothetical protein [unclassified Trichocoleus]MBD1906294.1 hypothetical protein [Trichocoleus sp. FACHB-832]MBD2061459.1 hypothetical protein [Trichocoleus sp. FACHB-6]
MRFLSIRGPGLSAFAAILARKSQKIAMWQKIRIVEAYSTEIYISFQLI